MRLSAFIGRSVSSQSYFKCLFSISAGILQWARVRWGTAKRGRSHVAEADAHEDLATFSQPITLKRVEFGNRMEFFYRFFYRILNPAKLKRVVLL